MYIISGYNRRTGWTNWVDYRSAGLSASGDGVMAGVWSWNHESRPARISLSSSGPQSVLGEWEGLGLAVRFATHSYLRAAACWSRNMPSSDSTLTATTPSPPCAGAVALECNPNSANRSLAALDAWLCRLARRKQSSAPVVCR